MKKLIASIFLIIAACHERRPPGPSAEQSAELNDADAMLNNIANEEGPEANAPGPSNSSD